MKIVKLFHNPSAGDQEHTRKELVKLIESAGYKCRYVSVKDDGWKEIEDDVDLVAIAGGDGAVRKVCKEVLKRRLLDRKIPVAVLPFGTANNIGNSLGLMLGHEALVNGWSRACVKGVDVGIIQGHDEESFFLEAVGFGIFPNLINKMKKLDEEPETAEESLKVALEQLCDIADTYEARDCRLVIDGVDHSGKFLLVEVMNMPYLGPNLNLNPVADPGDGELEVIIIPEDQRGRLAGYIKDKLEGKEPEFLFSTLKGRSISISWQGIHAHVDDTIVKEKSHFELKIDTNKGVLDMLIPA